MNVDEKKLKEFLEKLFLENVIDVEKGVPITAIEKEYDKGFLEECFLRKYVCVESGKLFLSQKGVQYILAMYS